MHERTYVKSQIHVYCTLSRTSLCLRTDIRPSQRATTSYSPPLVPCSSLIFHQFSNLGWNYRAVSVMQTYSSICTSSVASLLGICCTYVMITSLISPTGTRPPGSGFAASCEGPSNFRRLTKAPFSSVLLFFITQLQGIAELLKPQYCLGKTTY